MSERKPVGKYRYITDALPYLVADIQNIPLGRYENLHDSSCVGRVCLNPTHMQGGAEVIEVQPTPEERLRLTDGKDGHD